MELLLFNAFNGLIQGVFYALMALGLALILSLNSVINMAHGGFLVIGAYLAYTLSPYLGFWGALIAGPVLAAGIGLVVERVLIRPIYKRTDPIYSLLLTFGLALIIEDLTRTIWGAQGLPLEVPDIINAPVSEQYFFITGYRLFVVAITAAAAIGLYLLLRYTLLGIRIRAGTRDLETTSGGLEHEADSHAQARKHVERSVGAEQVDQGIALVHNLTLAIVHRHHHAGDLAIERHGGHRCYGSQRIHIHVDVASRGLAYRNR